MKYIKYNIFKIFIIMLQIIIYLNLINHQILYNNNILIGYAAYNSSNLKKELKIGNLILRFYNKNKQNLRL